MTDVAVIGSGPNGLAAAVVMARAGLEVRVFEAESTAGGGARTGELTEPGNLHDLGAAVHPMALASPFFRAFQLSDRVKFFTPDVSYGQPIAGTSAAIAWRDLERTADGLGRDGAAWLRLMGPLVEHIDRVVELTLSPVFPVPENLRTLLSYGGRVAEQGTLLSRLRFHEELAPALLAGTFAHAIGRIPSLSTASAGMFLAALAHGEGWPVPEGGSGAITAALMEDLEAHGGRVVTGYPVATLADLPPAPALIFDTTARALGLIAGNSLDPRYRRALRSLSYGDAASKVDFLLSEPVPWANPDLRRAGTVHVGGTRDEIARSEADVARGKHSTHPYVLASQPSLFDQTRSQDGHETLWTYTHVPAASQVDMTEAITRQIERFAPGFRDTILSSHATTAVDLERMNRNFIGGDIASGAASLRQLIARPVLSKHPWRAGRGVYLCSASAAPGPGVHGMGGFHAAKLALEEVFGLALPELGLEP